MSMVSLTALQRAAIKSMPQWPLEVSLSFAFICLLCSINLLYYSSHRLQLLLVANHNFSLPDRQLLHVAFDKLHVQLHVLLELLCERHPIQQPVHPAMLSYHEHSGGGARDTDSDCRRSRHLPRGHLPRFCCAHICILVLIRVQYAI